MARYVAYYRVRSGPGKDRNIALSAQREAARCYIASNGELVEEFTEDETQQQRRRPHFKAAIKSSKRHDAILVIPRFRPIHRSAAFVQQLSDAAIEFLALDVPGANRATIAAFAAAAAQHRERLSERVKTSLQAAKAHGRKLGNPKIALARPKAVQAASGKAQETRQALRGEVAELRQEGRSLRAIADELNRRGTPTPRGREWHASSVRRILTESNGMSA